ncbi:sulfatase-like hydrolase/transferase [Flavobacteriaceae bacterium]|nr:sulfatase-like hydrolase/transferase [Flavobacteriaceae bacterium]
MKNLFIIVLLVSLFFSCKSESEKPNFIFIYTDDQRFDTVGLIGDNQVITPNLDKLVKNGAVFSNTYNMGAWHGAICVASRSMIISGKSVWRAKEAFNSPTNVQISSEISTKNQSVLIGESWPKIFKKNGYKTYMTGKWHIQLPVEKVFDVVVNKRPGMPDDNRGLFGKQLRVWKKESGDVLELDKYMPVGYGRPVNENDNSWESSDSLQGGFWEGGKHWSEVLADDAINLIEDSKKTDDPFFMYLAFNAPHDPRQAPNQFLEMYPINQIKLPPNYSPQHPYWKEIGNEPGVRDEALAPYPRSEYAVKKHIQEYYAVISHLDEQVGKIVSHLESQNMLDNTYIIFTSDHGLAVGQHGLLGKQSLYDHSIRVPMIINGPNIKKGSVYSQDIYLQDIVPTTLDLANISIPNHIDFKSFYNLITNKDNIKTHDAIYGTFGCCNENYFDFQRMIRKDGYKLMLFPKNKRIELYDLNQDPYEINNLADISKYKLKVKDLYKELTILQKEMGDTLNLDMYFKNKL